MGQLATLNVVLLLILGAVPPHSCAASGEGSGSGLSVDDNLFSTSTTMETSRPPTLTPQQTPTAMSPTGFLQPSTPPSPSTSSTPTPTQPSTSSTPTQPSTSSTLIQLFSSSTPIPSNVVSLSSLTATSTAEFSPPVMSSTMEVLLVPDSTSTATPVTSSALLIPDSTSTAEFNPPVTSSAMEALLAPDSTLALQPSAPPLLSSLSVVIQPTSVVIRSSEVDSVLTTTPLPSIVTASILTSLSASVPFPTPMPYTSIASTVATTSHPGRSDFEAFFADLGISGIAGAGVALLVIVILLIIVCFLCCFCCCKRGRKYRRKARLDMSDEGISFANRGVANGVVGSAYKKYQQETSLLDLHHHHYDTVGGGAMGTYHYNETALDHELDGPSQMLPSQTSMANTDIFQKSNLPQLSPMAYSLTANYPFSAEDNDLYLNTLPASTLSLRQPTMFGLSLQNEESKSAQGSKLSIHGSRPSIHSSRLSIHGSRPSIHESRPSIYSSRTSSMHDSHHMLHMSGTSGESLLGLRYDKEHTIEDVSLSLNRVPSPDFINSNSASMEVPTRDSSPLSRPLFMATSHQLGHGKKDFASLTCIVNQSADSFGPSPEPEEHLVHHDLEQIRSPTHKKTVGKRDLTSLTSVPGPVSRGGRQQDTIPEEEESPKVKDSKNSSQGNKKGRSKTMSRLEKLTSLDYIRKSFRIKKKKVSFQNVKTPETTPTPPKKNVKNTSATVITNNMADKVTEGGQEVPHRRTSTASSDMFSPTEDGYFRVQQHHGYPADYWAGPGMGVAMGGGGPGIGVPMGGTGPGMGVAVGYAQLSQPNYYLPGYQHAYPQLSQQYYPQLSQGYGNPYSSPYHLPLNDSYRQGLREPQRDARYHEVVTPDITSPEHRHYRERSVDSHELGDRQGSEYSYELRPQSASSYDRTEGYRNRSRSPDKFTESSVNSEQYRKSPEHEQIHPDYFRSPGHSFPTGSPGHSFPVSSPQRYGMGHGMALNRRGSAEQEARCSRRSSTEMEAKYGRRSSTEMDSRRSSTEMDSRRSSTEMDSRRSSTEMDSRRSSTEMDSRRSSTEMNSRRSSTETEAKYGRRSSTENEFRYGRRDSTQSSTEHDATYGRRELGPSSIGRGAIPEAAFFNSISVDDEPPHHAINHQKQDSFQNRSMERRYSGYSESSASESKFAATTAPGKNKVSWSSEVTEYPTDDQNINH